MHPGTELKHVRGTLNRYSTHLDNIRCDILDTGFPLGDDSDYELTPRKLVQALLKENAALRKSLKKKNSSSAS